MSNKKEIDFLTEDPQIPNQKFVLLSFLSPEGIKNCKIRGLKVRGVFDDFETAKKYSEVLRNTCESDFHIFIGEVGKWLPWDPEPSSVGEENYAEKELNNLMKAYKEHQLKAKTMYEQRKQELMSDALQEQENKSKNKKNKLKSKSKLAEKENEIDKVENEVKVETKLLEAEEDKLKESEKNISNIDSELEKLKQMYNNLINK
jgi:hypothetical protein